MSLSCKRSAFEFDDGCPPVSVDLTFPDFESCEAADPGKLKSVSRLDLQKAPAFPMFIPGDDPVPVSIPDIEIPDYECPLDSFSKTGQRITVNSGNAASTGTVKILAESDSCSLNGIEIELTIPDYSGPSVRVSNGAIYYTFKANGSNELW